MIPHPSVHYHLSSLSTHPSIIGWPSMLFEGSTSEAGS
jgi:hypothetical protein